MVILSTENGVNLDIGKACSTIDSLSIIWKHVSLVFQSYQRFSVFLFKILHEITEIPFIKTVFLEENQKDDNLAATEEFIIGKLFAINRSFVNSSQFSINNSQMLI